ncbi:MAG: ADP-ribosylglycohydrolase family protein [Clostridia bacterium]|nr:ADP-ribosylglycohydrolase family protein [Clostridia bacterium]
MTIPMKLNRNEITDKILGCWIGKNIGGTMGTPFEGAQQLNDIHGFNSPKGEPLPNDDLDLQLVWLRAMQDVGPKVLSANILADYWLTAVTPHWNEYGIGKCNLEMGLLPPLSGEFRNDWKHSNGAWIRSEIWACLAPGLPDIAVKYAIMDASIDHGLAEGTYAEMFTASLESMAFFESDIRRLIEKALTFIPADCRVARSIRIVLNGYDAGTPWKQVREAILDDSRDLGWFQAPGNIAFTVLGLLYGEGDFKKTLITAIDCGDDTDCTGATAGALLGIILGAKGIPEDWKEYIGDKIVPICISASYRDYAPKTCTALTQAVLDTMPDVLKAYGISLDLSEEATEAEKAIAADLIPGYVQDVFGRSPWSFEVPATVHTKAVVEYDREPVVRPGEDFVITVTLENARRNPYHYEVNAALPEGWSADYPHTQYIEHRTMINNARSQWKMTVHVGETVGAVNRIQVSFSPKGHVYPVMIPIVLLG